MIPTLLLSVTKRVNVIMNWSISPTRTQCSSTKHDTLSVAAIKPCGHMYSRKTMSIDASWSIRLARKYATGLYIRAHSDIWHCITFRSQPLHFPSVKIQRMSRLPSRLSWPQTCPMSLSNSWRRSSWRTVHSAITRLCKTCLFSLLSRYVVSIMLAYSVYLNMLFVGGPLQSYGLYWSSG